MPFTRSRLSNWLREPLLHFIAIGVAMFVAFTWWGSGTPGSTRIVITPGQVDSLAASFTRVWQRPPTEQELKGLVDDYVREEIAVREATAMGLDRGDTVIRRRLRQKFEFLAEDALEAVPPSDEELQAWLDSHADAFRTEPEVAFRQVYLDAGRRGADVGRDAEVLLTRLRKTGPDAEIASLGDSLMLPTELSLTSRSDIARQFGERFADEVVTLEPGRWSGPVRSGYGWHVVLVTAREEGRLPRLDEIRPLVERELLSARRSEGLEALYAGLLGRYQVTVEQREAPQLTNAKPPSESSR
jgi:PPIC-type PPIASE domain